MATIEDVTADRSAHYCSRGSRGRSTCSCPCGATRCRTGAGSQRVRARSSAEWIAIGIGNFFIISHVGLLFEICCCTGFPETQRARGIGIDPFAPFD